MLSRSVCVFTFFAWFAYILTYFNICFIYASYIHHICFIYASYMFCIIKTCHARGEALNLQFRLLNRKGEVKNLQTFYYFKNVRTGRPQNIWFCLTDNLKLNSTQRSIYVGTISFQILKHHKWTGSNVHVIVTNLVTQSKI